MTLLCDLIGHKWGPVHDHEIKGGYVKKWVRFCDRCGRNEMIDTTKITGGEALEYIAQRANHKRRDR